jgi:hypothetical protein
VQEVMAALGSKLEAAEQTSRYLAIRIAVPHSSVADPDPAVKKLYMYLGSESRVMLIQFIFFLDPDSFPYS